MRFLRWLIVPAFFLAVFGVVPGEDPKQPGKSPTDQELLTEFHSHRAQFDRLASMAAADSRLRRIAGDWYLDAAGADYRQPRQRLLSAARWDEYRRLFSALRLQEGVLIWREGIEFLSYCEGLMVSGGCKGYVLLRKVPATEEICQSLDRLPMPAKPGDGVCYLQIEGPWYLFRDWT